MAGIRVSYDFGAEKRKKKEQLYDRQQKAIDARAELEDRGLSPDEAKAAVDQWVQTGAWDIPTRRTTNQIKQRPVMQFDPSTNLMDYGTFAEPIQQPISMRKREDVGLPYVVDSETGKITKPQMTEDFLASLDRQGFRPKPTFSARDTEKLGQDIYVNAKTGAEIRREPNHTKSNRVIKVGAAGGGPDSDPRTRAYLQTLAAYNAAIKKPGKDGTIQVSNELANQAVAAAKALGLPTHTIATGGPIPGWTGMAARTAAKLIPGDQSWGTAPAGTQEVLGPGENASPYQEPTTAEPPPATTSNKRELAIQWLTDNGAPVTDKNIDAVLKRGLVGGR